MLLLVCHAAGGHFADGNRAGVRHVLDHVPSIATITLSGPERYSIVCQDGGQLVLAAPGLNSQHAFHRMTIELVSPTWTADLLTVVFELMRAGEFGLMDGLEASQIFVTLPQQTAYFPALPEHPVLVRNSRDLGLNLLA
jgi:hypothetical protein